MTRPVALSIAGSDSGGGAGIQADLRTFCRLEVFGTTAITAVTAQNLSGVHATQEIELELIAAQIEAVLDNFTVGALKTGMLWSSAIVEQVASLVEDGRVPYAVVDPMIFTRSGSRLLQREALQSVRERLLPACTIATPDLDESAALLGSGPLHADSRVDVAAELGRRHGCAVLLDGGHLAGQRVFVLWDRGEVVNFAHQPLDVNGSSRHGTGCILSAAICALLARGSSLTEACARALAFAQDAQAHGTRVDGSPPERLPAIESARPDLDQLVTTPALRAHRG